MTKIVSSRPEEDPTDQQAGGPSPKEGGLGRASGLIAFLSIASLVGSVLALVACVYLWQAISDIRDIDSRLDKLATFESKILNRFDQSNAGMQALIAETNTRVANIRSSIQNTDGQRLQNIAALKDAVRKLRVLANSISVAGSNAAVQPKTISVPGNETGAENSAPAPSDGASEFRRVESADGSVTYQRIK